MAKVAEGLSLVQVAAGMVVNIEKSTISCLHLNEQETNRIALLLSFRIMELDAGIKYLGFF